MKRRLSEQLPFVVDTGTVVAEVSGIQFELKSPCACYGQVARTLTVPSVVAVAAPTQRGRLAVHAWQVLHKSTRSWCILPG